MEVLGLEKPNVLPNITSHQPDIDKIYLHAKDPYEAKNQLLINKREGVGNLKPCHGSKAFVEYSNDTDDIYENIGEYIPNKECEILIMFHNILLLICLAINNFNI